MAHIKTLPYPALFGAIPFEVALISFESLVFLTKRSYSILDKNKLKAALSFYNVYFTHYCTMATADEQRDAEKCLEQIPALRAQMTSTLKNDTPIFFMEL